MNPVGPVPDPNMCTLHARLEARSAPYPGSLRPTRTIQPRPQYQSLRYEEDWSTLRDPQQRTHLWDRVKYLPLNEDDWYVSLGGEGRLRYEALRKAVFGFRASGRERIRPAAVPRACCVWPLSSRSTVDITGALPPTANGRCPRAAGHVAQVCLET